jgi:surface carbohydrate biosynthesis protein
MELLKYLDRYSKDRAIRIRYVPPKTSMGYDKVKNFLDRHHSSSYELSTEWGSWTTSYDEVMSSHVVVGDNSSILVEAFGRGNRILSVNMSNYSERDFPVLGLWSMRLPTYGEFVDRLDMIRGLSKDEWRKETRGHPKNLVAFDSDMTTQEVLRRVISQLLLDTSSVATL